MTPTRTVAAVLLALLFLVAATPPAALTLEVSQEASAESVSLEESGGAEEPPEGCCVRQPRSEALHDGYGGSVDVGHCSRSCRHFASSEGEESLEVSEGECPGAWQCESVEVSLRREAGREVRVVDACGCRRRSTPCSRRPLRLRLFPDSPFEVVVDVGSCSGLCATGGCRAVSTRSVSVAGPNGARCVPVIERCACAPSCFRVRRLEVVHDYTGADGSLLKIPVVKEVDVGSCEGGCSSSRRGDGGVGGAAGERHCADPFWRAGRPCRSWLYARRLHGVGGGGGRGGEGEGVGDGDATCAPDVTSTRRYTTREGDRRRLTVIETCLCHQ